MDYVSLAGCAVSESQFVLNKPRSGRGRNIPNEEVPKWSSQRPGKGQLSLQMLHLPDQTRGEEADQVV